MVINPHGVMADAGIIMTCGATESSLRVPNHPNDDQVGTGERCTTCHNANDTGSQPLPAPGGSRR